MVYNFDMKVKNVISEVVKVIRRYLSEEYKVFLFGSYASGEAVDTSDIDMGILGPKEVPSGVLRRIKEEVEIIPTLRKIDVVDFNRVDEEFKDNALRKSKELTASAK